MKISLATGTAAMVKLTKMWENKEMSTNTKLRLMKALVWPVSNDMVVKNGQFWTLKKEEKRSLDHTDLRLRVHQEVAENSMNKIDD